MEDTNQIFKRLLQKLLNEAFTTILLVLIAYYFVTEERNTKKELIELYKEDRQELLQTIKKRNNELHDMYRQFYENK